MAERVIDELYGSRPQARDSMSAADRTVRFVMPHSLAGALFPGWWIEQHIESHGIRCMRIGHDRPVPVAGCDK
ncbi:hypothetical protein WS98_13590 [Burkholderia territorii]|nr:hypothetical protein WS94_02905 [Burkholderia territorii]KVL35770.1 hypothetical protein WS98_13590 [Burkholderia territorii]KVL46915.1 hypothetical protein WS99_23895 [Burkholderia territorii]KVQ43797.1 hypothetical protein WT21_21485 [Burkholderia territorii]